MRKMKKKKLGKIIIQKLVFPVISFSFINFLLEYFYFYESLQFVCPNYVTGCSELNGSDEN